MSVSKHLRLCLAAAGGLLMCAASALAGTAATISSDGSLSLSPGDAAAAPSTRVLRESAGGLTVNVQLDGVTLSQQKTSAGSFVSLAWPDASIAGEIGAPAIPVVRELFIVPQGAELLLSTSLSAPIALDLAGAGYDIAVMPVQAPIVKLPGARESAPFNYDAAAYAAGAAPGERVTVTPLGVMREQQLYLLEVRPVAYDATNSDVTLWRDIEATITFKNLGAVVPPAVTPPPGMHHMVLNPSLLPDTYLRGGGNYLIITCQTYEAGIAPFGVAKSAQGFNVMTHVVPDGTSRTVIKSYIEGLWGTADAPDYILLVGDTDKIPHWTGGGDGSPATDLPYSCMDGPSDWYADIAIGRFSVRSMTELNAMIDKTLLVEDGPLPDIGYTARSVFMASNDNYTVSEGTHNYVINTHMTPNAIDFEKLYCHTYNATTQQVRNAFNSGKLYGVYSGHGSDYSWADGPPFSQTDVRNLTNDGMPSVVWSFACITGNYPLTECFMETWVRQTDTAAVAAWGSSVNSYWTEDDVLEKVLFDVMFFDSVRELGPLWNLTLMGYLDQMGGGSFTRRYFEMYNLMGDPALYIPFPGGDLSMGVSPFGDFNSEGQAGGPFTPAEKVYTIENRMDVPMQYEVAVDVAWLSVDVPTGMIPAEDSAAVTVSVNGSANSLGNGEYTGTISFVNYTNHDGDCQRDATLTIGVPEMVYAWNMDSNPGWSTEGQWAFGQPTGNGGDYGYADPTSGHTGPNVFGYNLSGDYTNNMPEYDLTTGAIDCTDLTQVSLRFWRWLGVETPSYDHAYIKVSTNGTSWTTVWENLAEIEDNSWNLQEIDISDYADGESTVYIRWTMGTTDSSWTYCGWNIDDVEIWGLQPSEPPICPDLNGDGVVDQEDLGLLLAAYGIDDGGDVDGDGDTDQADLGALLSWWGQPCP